MPVNRPIRKEVVRQVVKVARVKIYLVKCPRSSSFRVVPSAPEAPGHPDSASDRKHVVGKTSRGANPLPTTTRKFRIFDTSRFCRKIALQALKRFVQFAPILLAV